MNYKTWTDETKRGLLTPRSTELKAVDTAFKTCGDSVTGTTPNKKLLFDKLKLWLKKKGTNWKSSTRNSKKVGGKGTVERLIADFASQPYFKPQVAQLNLGSAVAKAPVSNAYVPGKWDRTSDDDGVWHEFIRQKKGNSCVPTTIVMMKRAYHNLAANQLSEEQIRGVMTLEETGNLNKGISTLRTDVQAHHDWENVGTGPERAANVLKAQPHPVSGVKILNNGDAATLSALNKLSPRKPGLIGWRWNAGGGHFTMCVGPTKDKSRLKIIDPWNGIKYIDNSNPGFTNYSNNTGKFGVAIVGA